MFEGRGGEEHVNIPVNIQKTNLLNVVIHNIYKSTNTSCRVDI